MMLRLYFILVAASIRSELQYRANFAMRLLISLVYQGSSITFIWIILDRFPTISGWHLGDIAFLYGWRLLSGGLTGLIFSPMAGLDRLVREGEFDRYLVRPLSPLVQILGLRFQLFLIWDALFGLLVFLISSTMISIRWSVLSVTYVVLSIIGGCLIQAALIIGIAAVAFRTLDTTAAMWLYQNTFTTFSNYPLKIFDSTVRFILTFLFPVAFVAYFPTAVLLGRTKELSIPPFLAYLAPLLGVLLFGAMYMQFRREISNYQSTGH